jgi:phospholipid/cholesterol/gamma-HCH transport system permease protein
MQTTPTALPQPRLLGPAGWVGRTVLATLGYAGGVTILAGAAAASALRPRIKRGSESAAPGFVKTLMNQLGWMLGMGVPLVGLVHIAIGSFLSLQAYYGSTFVEGTGAVVGVGLLRNLGGLMTGMTFAGILAARMIPELRVLARSVVPEERPEADRGGLTMRVNFAARGGEAVSAPIGVMPTRLAAPRIAAAAVGCLLLSQWGVTVGTVVGWLASQSLMGISTETFFMMMLKMMWFRDVTGLVAKGIMFGALSGAISCYEGLGSVGRDDGESNSSSGSGSSEEAQGVAPAGTMAVFRAVCLACVGILILNSSWFMLVYHAVPFYGPTLLAPPGP